MSTFQKSLKGTFLPTANKAADCYPDSWNVACWVTNDRAQREYRLFNTWHLNTENACERIKRLGMLFFLGMALALMLMWISTARRNPNASVFKESSQLSALLLSSGLVSGTNLIYKELKNALMWTFTAPSGITLRPRGCWCKEVFLFCCLKVPRHLSHFKWMSDTDPQQCEIS